MVILTAQPRQERGKRVKHLRTAGILPVVLYGEGIETQPLSVLFKDFEKAYQEAGESTLVTLTVDGAAYTTLIYDVAYDPLRGAPIHADFYAVRMDKTIRTKVPIEFFGESPAVKNEGGILVKVIQELEVEALPNNLPKELRVDLGILASLESKLFIRDIPVPAGVRIFANADDRVAVVEPPRSEEELKATLGTTAEPAVTEVKTEQELKREAKAEEKATAETGTEEKK